MRTTTRLMALAGLMLAIILTVAPHISVADEADLQPAFVLMVAAG